MLPFRFRVDGPPLSHQTKNRQRLQAWRNTVRAAAMQLLPPGHVPLTISLRIVVAYLHDGPAVRLDNDNMVKPNQDALNGLVYADDRQITDTQVLKRDINGHLRVRRMSRILAEGLIQGTEFIYVEVRDASDQTEFTL